MLPFIRVTIGNRSVKALVDTGCQQSVLVSRLCNELGFTSRGPQRIVEMLNGNSTRCCGEITVDVFVHGQNVKVKCLMAPLLVCDFQMIIGMDVINTLGGVYVGNDGKVWFGQPHCAVGVVKENHARTIKIDESDFTAIFDGVKWTVEWKWERGEPELVNRCSEYRVPSDCREEFEEEVEQWIQEGWLQVYDPNKHGRADGVIPLMAARQPNKPKKVRPVMDYRELNSLIKSNPGVDVAVCQEKLRAWRMKDKRAAILDLKKAYLQVHVSERLQKFQLVKYRGCTYVMTRMGFGLSVAPKVMSKIITTILSLDSRVSEGTDHYIDDIWVDESIVSAEQVRKLLLVYGLTAKDPVSLANSRVLGLRVVKGQDNRFKWFRDGKLPVLSDAPTKRELFSVFGKLTGHYPVAGWLRVACSYIKRQTNEFRWDEAVSRQVKVLAEEVMEKVSKNDPVTGEWSVNSVSEGLVWCDASSLAVGCCLEVDSNIVEDATWLRKDDGSHINVAELEAVIKGVNMALRWGITTMTVITDSASVCGWVRSILEDSKRPKVSGLGEMVTKRRLGIIAQLIEEYDISMKVRLVSSVLNKADKLTRVPQKWLRSHCLTVVTSNSDIRDKVRSMHAKHHLGVKKTLYLAREVYGDEVREPLVKDIVDSCNVCRRVDPAPVSWDHGGLSVDKVWQRVAVDITYVNKRPYLTLVDCGPSRFAIWKGLVNETSTTVVRELNRMFAERGAPDEMLCDNGPCFRSTETATFLKAWGVTQIFCCAYKHSGNGIVERNHRTIKRMVARTGGKVEDMVYWYNNSPNYMKVVPAKAIYQYESRLFGTSPVTCSREKAADTKQSPYNVGDKVFVKPKTARCDTTWKDATITRVVSKTVVEVDGINRHIADVRAAAANRPDAERNKQADVLEVAVDYDGAAAENEPNSDFEDDHNSESSTKSDSDDRSSAADDEGSDDGESTPSGRNRRPPKWLADFYVDL